MSIRTRLLLLVLAAWLPAVVAIGLLARFTWLQEVQDARARVERQAVTLAAQVEQALSQRETVARTLAASLAVRDGDAVRFAQEARGALQGSQDWAALLDREAQWANTNRTEPPPGVPVARTPGTPFNVDAAPLLHFTLSGRQVQHPMLALLVREAQVQPPRYNVAVAFRPEVLQGIVDRQAYPAGGIAAVVDARLRVLARSRDPQKWLGREATGDLRQRALAGEAGFAPSVTLDGIASLSYLGLPDRYGCRVVIALPQSVLALSAERLTLQASAGAAALLVLGLLLALQAARRIGAPVLALRDAAAQLGREEVPPRLRTGVSEADEVAAALHEAGLRTRESTRELERRVAEAVQDARDAQEKLFTAQKHEAIGRLTGGIAHDFNNLLQTIATGLHVLDRFVTEPRQRRVLESALRATARAAELIRQMLAFGRAQPLQPRAVSLDELLLASQELTAKALGQRVTLTADVAPGVPALRVDPAQFELALLNLIFNARDAMPDGGCVTVSARVVAPEDARALGLPEGRFVCVEVADDGPGMDPQTLARAFDPYFTTKPVGAGSGIGLPQVLAFARQSGGDAQLVSRPGAGTLARLYLPASEAAAELADAQTTVLPGMPASMPPLDVLMVEDDVLVASVVRPALEALGHRVRLCGRADEAQALLADPRLEVDVLFTDVVMPGAMTGLDLVHWCAEHRPGLPVVVATGFSAQALPATSSERVQVLRKPYGLQALAAALQQAVARQQADASVRPAA